MIETPQPETARLRRHRAIQEELAALDDAAMVRWLAGTGVEERGNATASLPSGAHSVFVKLVPVSARERAAPGDTANLFALPLHYQYRIGSCGFGAWREWAVHELANAWVEAGACSGFALLHHARVLPVVSRGVDDKRRMEPWGDDPAIARRVAALADATSSVVLCMERFSQTVHGWLGAELARREDRAALLGEAEAKLLRTVDFANGRGVLHMDAHLENFLTDGAAFFLSDHGLAIAPTFALGADELEFMGRHRQFDRCTVVSGLVYTLVLHHGLRELWRAAVDGAGIEGVVEALPARDRAFLEGRGPLALEMSRFYRNLRTDLTSEYPAERLAALL